MIVWRYRNLFFNNFVDNRRHDTLPEWPQVERLQNKDDSYMKGEGVFLSFDHNIIDSTYLFCNESRAVRTIDL